MGRRPSGSDTECFFSLLGLSCHKNVISKSLRIKSLQIEVLLLCFDSQNVYSSNRLSQKFVLHRLPEKTLCAATSRGSVWKDLSWIFCRWLPTFQLIWDNPDLKNSRRRKFSDCSWGRQGVAGVSGGLFVPFRSRLDVEGVSLDRLGNHRNCLEFQDPVTGILRGTWSGTLKK